MSNEIVIQDRIYAVEAEFNQINPYKISFNKEVQFAMQVFSGNAGLIEAARKNPESLEYAMLRIASIGISLNPALAEAYLIPRAGKVVLDISYRGLMKLATDTGSILWVQAQTVREKDNFAFNGIGTPPKHEMNPFGQRGEIVGVYCVARTVDGDSLTTMMSLDECLEIRDKSSQAKFGPWKDWGEEMMKKTVIKRASKLWPKSDRLNSAIQVINEHEGIEFKNNKLPHVDKESLSRPDPDDKEISEMMIKLTSAKRSQGELIDYLKTRFPKDSIDSLENLSGAQYAEASKALDSIILKQGKK
jgi:recombination protein RecT